MGRAALRDVGLRGFAIRSELGGEKNVVWFGVLVKFVGCYAMSV